MITEDLQGSHEGLRLLHLFLTPKEQTQLQTLAAEEDNWEPGQQGTGYFKLNLLDISVLDRRDWLTGLAARAQLQLLSYANREGLQNSDCWLLYCPDQSRAPAHLDPCPDGFRHVRLDAVAKAPASGGTFNFTAREGGPGRLGLGAGDALVFSASELEHAVDKVVGSRLVFSCGGLVQR